MSVFMCESMYLHTQAHTQKENKLGKMLKTGKPEKGFFTMFSINLKLLQKKNTLCKK